MPGVSVVSGLQEKAQLKAEKNCDWSASFTIYGWVVGLTWNLLRAIV